jgi:hypothetical protein
VAQRELTALGWSAEAGVILKALPARLALETTFMTQSGPKSAEQSLSIATVQNAATKQKGLDDAAALVSSEGY